MEFPNVGVGCSLKECKQLDFLPFICKYCNCIFCKEHFHVSSHLCSKFIDNLGNDTKITNTFSCSQESCIDKSITKMLCIKCNKHFCLLHRVHGCFEQSQEQIVSELEKWEKPKREFLEAKNAIDKNITNKLRKSKDPLAQKIQLMRLKGKSTGPEQIPTNERFYFSIHLPINGSIKNFVDAKSVFVSANWSVGRVIDSIADSINIPNNNNVANAKKLKMFHYSTGEIVTNQMDVILSEMLKNNRIINGQEIILEYSNDDKVDYSLYK